MNKFLSAVLFLGLMGCANKALMHSSVVPKSVFKIEQASVLSPNEKNWYIMQNDLQSIVFVKKYDDASQTAVLNTMLYTVGKFKNSKEFLHAIADQRTKQDDKKRFKILNVKNDYVKFKDLPCLKYNTLSEDHKDKGIESKDFEFFKTSGYICRYPTETTSLQFEVSHRSMGKELPADLVAVTQEFFNDIMLAELTVKALKAIP